jgi:hypothetical protein
MPKTTPKKGKKLPQSPATPISRGRLSLDGEAPLDGVSVKIVLQKRTTTTDEHALPHQVMMHPRDMRAVGARFASSVVVCDGDDALCMLTVVPSSTLPSGHAAFNACWEQLFGGVKGAVARVKTLSTEYVSCLSALGCVCVHR